MALELHDMKKDKTSREEVWCTQCRSEGHDRDQCPMARTYLNTGTPNQFNPGIAQIQAQLVAMALELRDMKKAKTSREEVCCTQSRSEGHDRDQCPVARTYLNTGAPNQFNPGVLYYEICRTSC